MIFGKKRFDKRVDPADPPTHGRFIDLEAADLDGEAAQQRTEGIITKSLRAPSDRLPTEYPSSPEGPTYYDQPVLQTPVWKWPVPLYFYLGGTAGGALVLGAAAQVTDGRSLRSLIQRCRWVGVTGLSLGTACLIWDLGKRFRFLNMLRVFRPTSPLSIGSWLLTTGTPLAGAAAVLGGLPVPFRRWGNFAGYAAGVLGMPLTGYTGVVLAETAIPAWQEARRMLPVMFISSSVSGAASIIDLMDLAPPEKRVVRTFGMIGKAAEVATMFAVERGAARVERVARPFHSGKSGFLWKIAKVFSIASIAISLVPVRSKRKHQVAGVLGTVGAVANRFAIFEAGKASAADPRATFDMQRRGFGAAKVIGEAAFAGPRGERAAVPPEPRVREIEVIPPAAPAGREHKTKTFIGRPA